MWLETSGSVWGGGLKLWEALFQLEVQGFSSRILPT